MSECVDNLLYNDFISCQRRLCHYEVITTVSHPDWQNMFSRDSLALHLEPVSHPCLILGIKLNNFLVHFPLLKDQN